MTGLFGYLSSIVSGWGMGRILDAYGWDVAFQMLLACAFLSILPFIFAWSAKPNDLEKLEEKVHEAEHILLPRVVADIAQGKIKIG